MTMAFGSRSEPRRSGEATLIPKVDKALASLRPVALVRKRLPIGYRTGTGSGFGKPLNGHTLGTVSDAPVGPPLRPAVLR
jgi:hypothetical protein